MTKKQKNRKQLNESAKTVQAVYQQAIGVYESALDSLQNKNFSKAHEQFQEIIDRFPEEHELRDRCYLYLRVCQRASNVPVSPKTFDEYIFAATIKINAGNQKEALRHLEQAMAQNPNSDEVHYITALALAASGDITAIDYLQRAIDLNSDNRFLARQETGFELLQENDDFQKVLELPITPSTGE
jgi:predicted Zn-dependent protease